MIKKFRLSVLALTLLALAVAFPAWGAMSDEEFVKLCRDGSVQQIRAELLKGANPNAKDNYGVTALILAAGFNKKPEVVSVLLKAGVDVNAKDNEYGWTALMHVAAGNAPEAISILSLLLKAGADVNAKDKDGNTALMGAVHWNKNPEIISVLLKAGAYVNAKDNHGRTALMLAAEHNKKPEIFSLLLKAGADVNARTRYGDTALMSAAAYNKNPEVVSLLLRGGADINAKDKDGYTALIRAAGWNENPEVISVLMEAGADVNARIRYGDTALMVAAAFNKNPEVIYVLLKAGADVNAKHKVGKTALDYAREKGNTDVVKLLEEAFAASLQAGDPEAQYQLGIKYATGNGVKQDDKKAVEWLRKAAKQGHKKAKEALALYE